MSPQLPLPILPKQNRLAWHSFTGLGRAGERSTEALGPLLIAHFSRSSVGCLVLNPDLPPG